MTTLYHHCRSEPCPADEPAEERREKPCNELAHTRTVNLSAGPTVYIVDDDPDILEAVAEMVTLIGLKAEPYQSADAFLNSYRPTGPACLVLDVRMPGMGGIELQRALLAAGVALPIIMITGHGEIRMAVEVMKAGAVEFLEKPFRMQELCESIQQTIRREEENWRRRRQQEDSDQRLACLTPAERRVLELIAVGKTNQMMAEELGLSVRAIEDRRSRMMKKLQVKSRAELMELVHAAGQPLGPVPQVAAGPAALDGADTDH